MATLSFVCRGRGGGRGKLVEVRRLESLASFRQGGVLALVRPQQRQVRVCRPRRGPQRGVVASPAQGHRGGLTGLAVPAT